jgi:hypothetical protein
VEATIKREAEHAEVPITQLICRTLTDHTELLNSLMHHDANLPCGCDIQKSGCSVETFRAGGALGRHLESGCEVVYARDDEVGGKGCA